MARLISGVGMISLVTLALFTAIPLLSLALPFDVVTPDLPASQVNPNLIQRTNGNPQAAGDLYGVGLRVGAYLQIFGMLFSCVRTENRSRDGILLLSSSVCLSLFLALTILMSRRDLSPCETWLILSLTAAYGAPRFFAFSEKSEPKAGVATVCCLLSLLWQHVLYFWFWTTLYEQLPLLATANLAWFFVPVDLAGWFRTFMLVATCIDATLTAAAIGPYVDLILIRFVFWTGAEVSADDGHQSRPERKPSSKWNPWDQTLFNLGQSVRRLQDKFYYQKFVGFGDEVLGNVVGQLLRIVNASIIINRLSGIIARGRGLIKRLLRIQGRNSDDVNTMASAEEPPMDPEDAELNAAIADFEKAKQRLQERKQLNLFKGFVILVLTIAGVEKIIEYNSLYPTSDLSTPGQVIPFMLGIITFIVGLSHAIKPTSHGSETPTSAKSTKTSRPKTPSVRTALRTGDNDLAEWFDVTGEHGAENGRKVSNVIEMGNIKYESLS